MNTRAATLSERVSSGVVAAILAASALVPAILLSNQASADQLNNRYIDMSANQTSEGSGRDGGDVFGEDVSYRVGFDVNQAHTNIEGIVVEFCSDSPIYGDTCTAPAGFDVNTATLAVTPVTGVSGTWAIDAASDANTLILTNATGDALVANDTVELDLGTVAATDGITNPTATGTFYARIVTYDAVANAVGYTSADPDAVGAHLDEGGIALAVANELTITARVQEVLEFCVGTETDSTGINFAGADAADSCTDVAGTNLDLGVVDANSVNTTNTEGNDGVFLIRTNALNGATVYYKAEQETGLTNGGAGTLRQTGLDNCATIGNVDNGCFNSAGGEGANPTQSAITAGTELFGMTLRDLSTDSGGATTAVTCDAEYDAAGSCLTPTIATGYAWDPTGAFDTLASSTGPIDDERANIEFAATASPTTPTGLYTVTANFVATSTF